MIAKSLKWLVCLVILCGCQSHSEPKDNSYIQKCLMCGSEYTVIPYDDSKISPTVEWCFDDGRYCLEGMSIITEIMTSGQTEQLKHKLIRHCETCNGCKYAAFSPEEWSDITKDKK